MRSRNSTYSIKEPEPGIRSVQLCCEPNCDLRANSKDRCRNHYKKMDHLKKISPEKARFYYENNALKQRDKVLQKEFGITLEEYENRFEEQRGCCSICGEHQSKLKRRLAVDHDHKTGKVRSLLCGKCNTGLGQFNDDEELLVAAANYLRKYIDV